MPAQTTTPHSTSRASQIDQQVRELLRQQQQFFNEAKAKTLEEQKIDPTAAAQVDR